MAQRITDKHLQSAVHTLNTMLGLPTEPYVKTDSGEYVENYLLDHAYGAVALHQQCARGGERTVLDRDSKRELLARIQALIQGIQIAQGR